MKKKPAFDWVVATDFGHVQIPNEISKRNMELWRGLSKKKRHQAEMDFVRDVCAIARYCMNAGFDGIRLPKR